MSDTHDVTISGFDLDRLESELAEARKLRARLELCKGAAQRLADRVVRQENELAAVKQTMGELCESCGWSMRLPDQPCRCELERELLDLKKSIASLSHPNCRDLLREPDEARGQRDRLAEALEMIATHNHEDGQCDNGYTPSHIAKQALAAAKGCTPNNCQRPELCLLTETCRPCAICPNAVEGGSHD